MALASSPRLGSLRSAYISVFCCSPEQVYFLCFHVQTLLRTRTPIKSPSVRLVQELCIITARFVALRKQPLVPVLHVGKNYGIQVFGGYHIPDILLPYPGSFPFLFSPFHHRRYSAQLQVQTKIVTKLKFTVQLNKCSFYIVTWAWVVEPFIFRLICSLLWHSRGFVASAYNLCPRNCYCSLRTCCSR